MGKTTRRLGRPAAWLAMLVFAATARGGGSGENLLLFVDPAQPASMYIANYYKSVRNIPDRNFLYFALDSLNYQNFAARQLDAFLGKLANSAIEDHIDYVAVPPGSPFFHYAFNLIGASGCPAPVTRMSISSCFTLARQEAQILGGGLTVMEPNHFYANSDTARAFYSSVKYFNGAPSGSALAQRYFIGFMLGYDGERGNTLHEIIAMIDRSVAADGTRPAGRFYFMKTDDIRSTPRDPHFPAAIAAIQSLGGQAEQIDAVLPAGRHDALGILTGFADPAIDSTDMTILPGAFCDHLTSFAAMFDIPDQVKMSRWIARGAPANGASGTMGTVEEPCIFGVGVTGKFPHPRMHVWYFQGLSLGEALFRSIQWAPFQCLFYGDPLTQPFAYIPVVSVADAPTGPVSGAITLTPSATTDRPGAAILDHQLFVDGVRRATVPNGGVFTLDTTLLDDGVHDLRVLSRDNSLVASVGRWVGSLNVNNHGRSASLNVTPLSGDRSTPFNITVSGAGAAVFEVRLFHNGRVVAAAPFSPANFSLLGEVFGAGPVKLVAQAEFADGRRAWSGPVVLNIAYANPPTGADPNSAPTAYGYTLDIAGFEPLVIDLPASDPEDGVLTRTIVTAPSQGNLEGIGPTVLFRRNIPSSGTDLFAFTVSDGRATSNTATIQIRYSGAPPDTTAPTPNPMTFSIPPSPLSTSSITMQAAEATDAQSPPVEYFFDYTGGAPGGHDSAWQPSRDYVDTGLPTPNAGYNYTVRARDSNDPPNVTAPSTSVLGSTAIQTPTGVAFSNVTDTSLTVTATGTFTNLTLAQSGIYVEMSPAHGSGANSWTQNPTRTITGLSPGTLYTFRAKARNFQGFETPYTATFTQMITGGACPLPGDVDGSGTLNSLDIAGFVRVKLGMPGPGDNALCADFGNGNVSQDTADFAAALLGVP